MSTASSDLHPQTRGQRLHAARRRWLLIACASLIGALGVLVMPATSLGATGDTWTSQTTPANNAWRSVTYGNGLFVAVAYSGTGNRVMTSPDGITWTSRTNPVDNEWVSVTYGNGLFVAVSWNGTNRVMTSPDGIDWTSRTAAADNAWQSVTYGNGLFVAVAQSGSGNRVMTSPDGITWTIRTSAADNFWFTVTYGNGTHKHGAKKEGTHKHGAKTVGVVTAVGSSSLTITDRAGVTRTITVNADTKLRAPDRDASGSVTLADILVGDKVKIQLLKSDRTVARSVKVEALKIVGTVAAVGADSVTITLADATQKTLTVNADTKLEIPDTDASGTVTLADLKVGDAIRAKAIAAAGGTLLALRISAGEYATGNGAADRPSHDGPRGGRGDRGDRGDRGGRGGRGR